MTQKINQKFNKNHLIVKFFIMVTTSIASTALAGNPFFETYKTPHQTIPFNLIKNEHYIPAFEEAIRQHNKEIETITNNSKSPTFKNTIEALEYSGRLLDKVSSPFFNLLSAETNDELQQIAEKISPELTEHFNSIYLNDKLFQRIKIVYGQKDKLQLTPEQNMLLQQTYDAFIKNGANLSDTDKEIFRQYTKELNLLTLQFGQNVLKETNQYQLLIKDKKVLSGLPEDLLNTLAENARKAGKEGWMIDLKQTTYSPIMKYADQRDLRRELYLAYNTRCMKGGEYDNQEIIKKIVNLRLKIAQLLGYSTYADYVLVHRMAENKENVYDLLNKLLTAYKPTARKEYEEIQIYADAIGAYFKVQPWDWSYYSEKLKSEKYQVNDELLKPYFELEKVKNGVFGLATRLYGIHFTKNPKIPVYHPEVEAYEVTDKDGKFIAVLYTDFHPREGKQSGAWMSEFKGQWKKDGKDSRPQIVIVMNFTKPTATKPALLTFEEVTTFLHEFGHSLHGMLSDCTYPSLSGTNVYRDFVELPSQIMENWAFQKEFLDDFAAHYETNEKIPDELINKIKEAKNFHVAYACLRQLGFGYLDMGWHTLSTDFEGNIIQFEKKSMIDTQILPDVENTAISPTFTHVFSGGYAAGYYSYKWAEVLEADAFSVFEKNGIFDQATANSFLENILKKGGTEHPMILYKRFRGQQPTIDALLRRNGIVTNN